MLKVSRKIAVAFVVGLFPAVVAAHEGKATEVMTEMANYHDAFVNDANAKIDTTKLVGLLKSGGDSKTEKDAFAAALPLAVKLGKAGSAKERLDVYAELTEKLAPLHGLHDKSGTSIFYCPMVKKKWVARGDAVVNPYGKDMRSCGSKTDSHEHHHEGM